jgi:RNA polymerase sigma factor (TIGR02999 family)
MPRDVLANDTSDVTRILSQIESGEPDASERLLPLVYDELRKLAANRLAREKPGQTLQATALVHEAYVRLVAAKQPDQTWEGRGHFFASAAEAMRRILVENARRKQGPQHGGNHRRVEINTDDIVSSEANFAENALLDVLALDEALTRLARVAPERAELVKLRFFAGLTMSEVASVLGISRATAARQWAFARAWLFAELSEFAEPNGPVENDTPIDLPRSDTRKF